MLSTTFFGTSNILAKNNISDQSTVLKIIIFPSRVKLANCRILKTLSVSSKTFRNFSQNS